MRRSERLKPVRLRRWLVVLLLAVLGSVAGPGVSPASAATSVEVEPGWAGTYDPGDHVPVRVRITTDRLVRGEVEVSAPGGPRLVAVVVPVEVPGGSTKEYVVAVPTEAHQGRLELVATFRADGNEIGQGSGAVEPAPDVEAVGLLPGALADRSLPGAAPLAIDAGTARFAEVRPEELATPLGLSGLDVLGAARGELAALDEEARSAVLTWLGSGGRLLVDEAPGEAVPGLPDAWQPGPRGRTAANVGEVRAVDGAVGGARWDGLVEPTPLDRAGYEQFTRHGSIEPGLAADAGLRLPELNWLVGFLLVYVLGAVPVTLTVLRRTGRAEWGWVAVPLVAVVFTLAGYGAGRGLRSDTNLSHATTIRTGPVGAWADTSVGIVSSGGGAVVTGFPRGWAVDETTSWRFGGGNVGDLRARLANGGTELHQRLQPGQFATHSATGPLEVDGRLDVVAQAIEGDTVRGVVRNTMPFDLDEVAVFQGLAAAHVGLVEAGGEQPFELQLHRSEDPWEPPADRVWRSSGDFGGAFVDGRFGGGRPAPPLEDALVSMPQWDQVILDLRSGSASPGMIRAAGWTRDYRPPVAGDAAIKGRTVVIGSAPLVRSDAGFHPAAVATSKVRTPLDALGSPLVVRFVLPDPGEGQEPVDTAGLVVRAPADGVTLELWVDGAWSPLDPGAAVPAAGGGNVFGPESDHPLPPGAAHDGVVWARVSSPSFDVSTLSALDLVTLEVAP